jgi:hypothetical protein
MKTRRLAATVLLLAFVGGVRAASAQPISDRFEVAANLNMLRLSDFDSTNAGIGGRISFELTKLVALEGEFTFFPNDRIVEPESNTSFGPFRIASHRRRADALFGIKVGSRSERFGVFAKARPGLTRLIDRGTGCEGPGCAVILMLIARNSYRTEFAFDLGGGVEVYPTAHTVARFEMGDTMIRHRSAAPPCPASQCTSHNLSSRLGIGYRF